MNNPADDHDAPTPARTVIKELHRTQRRQGILWLAVSVFLAVMVVGFAYVNGLLDRSNAAAQHNASRIDELSRYVREVCEPIESDPNVQQKDPRAAELCKRAREDQLPKPISPPRGPAGLPGEDGTDGKDGQDGLPGSPGSPGSNGTNGKDGANPPCLAEPNQCRGEDGEDGKDGQDGENGLPGSPGPQCPEGFTGTKRLNPWTGDWEYVCTSPAPGP